MMDGSRDPERDPHLMGRLEAAFFWFLFGGFGFALVVVVPAAIVGIEGQQLYQLTYLAAGVLALYGAVTRQRPPGF